MTPVKVKEEVWVKESEAENLYEAANIPEWGRTDESWNREDRVRVPLKLKGELSVNVSEVENLSERDIIAV